jgi:ribonuclease III
VKQTDIDNCQQVLGYTFKDPKLLEKALTHSSVATTRLDSNERMEFLGDSVLGLVICEKLFRDHKKAQEGQLTKVKSAVVSRQVCAAVAVESGLTGLMPLGKGFDLSTLPQSLAAGLFEALVGAIYLDGGMEEARRFILDRMSGQIQCVLDNQHSQNYKSILQQHAQREWNCTPEYEMLDEKGPDHAKAFEICVRCRDRRFASAWGANKKEAEQLAARAALLDLKLVVPEDE